jgi:spore coat protein H
MNKQSWLAPTAVVLGIIMASALSGPLSAQAPGVDEKDKPKAKQPATKDTFGLTKVHEFHLELTAKEWANLQAVRGGMPFGGPKKQPEKPGAQRLEFHKGASAKFPWAHAEFTAEGKSFKNVGVRYKGNATFALSSGLLRRPLQIELDHFDGGERFHGLRKLSLANGITDPARVREALAFAVFRAGGVSAPRTAFTKVTLTVPGKFNKEYVGLYTLIEHVGNPFLKEHFKSAKGVLLKPEGGRGLEYLGEDWGPYEMRYRPKSEVSKEQKKRLIAFVRLVNKADDEQFKKEIGAYLDVDAFLRFLAVNALIVNLDSFLAGGHNFYLYLRPDTNRFVFVPWDMDVAFGVVPWLGPGDQQATLSVNHPHVGQNKLIDRLLAMKDVNEKYQKVLKDLSATCFTTEKLLADIDAIETATKEHRAAEKTAAAARLEGMGTAGGLFAKALPLRDFVEKRTASVLAQLAGTSKGYVPVMNAGPGGAKGGPGKQLVQALGGPFLVFRDQVQNELQLAAGQKQKLLEKFPDYLQETMKVFEQIKEAKPEEREKVMQEHRHKSGKKLSALLKDVLQAKQQERLLQLQFQQEGAFALVDQHEAFLKLQITDEQRKQFMGVVQDMQKKIAPLIKDAQSGGNPAEIMPMVMKIRRAHESRIEAILSDVQRKQWKKLLGKPLELDN